MTNIDMKLVIKLENGDFSEVDLTTWSKEEKDLYFIAIITGCDKTLDYDKLNQVFYHFHESLLENNEELSKQNDDLEENKNKLKEWLEDSAYATLRIKNGESMSIDELQKLIDSLTTVMEVLPTNNTARTHISKQILYIDGLASYKRLITKIQELIHERSNLKNTLTAHLKRIIKVCRNHYEQYSPILAKLIHSPDENIRLFCCCNVDLKSYDFSEDESPRVRRIYELHKNFNELWNNPSTDTTEKENIEFVANILEEGNCHFVQNSMSQGDFCIKNSWYKVSIKPEVADEALDVFCNVQDKRLLTAYIISMLADKKIEFTGKEKPTFFEEFFGTSPMSKNESSLVKKLVLPTQNNN